MRERSKISKEYLLFPILLFFGILLVLSESLGFVSFLRSGISFVADPVVYQGNILGLKSREYVETFVDLGDFRKEFNDLSQIVYEMEVENSFYSLLKEENESLKKQISFGNEGKKYLISKVVGGLGYDFLQVNKGSTSGVTVGDTVVFGNMFVGSVVRVDEKTCLVRLPTSKNNNLEVVVVKPGIEEMKISENMGFVTKGVVRGSADGIRIENMSMSANLENGDVVVVNDSSVGEYLILGYLVGLSENPAATSRSGFVSPILEYDELMTIYIRKDF